MNKLIKNKKGSLLDLVVIGVALFLLAFGLLIGFKLMDELNDKIQDTGFIPTEAKTASTELLGKFTNTLDQSMLYLAIGLGMATLIMASLVRIHPIFIPFYIIGLIIVIFFCGIYSELYSEMAAQPQFVDLAGQL